MATNIPPWSYSSLTKFETCPRQYALVRVYKKVKDEQGEEAKWGDFVHKALELRIKENKPLPSAMYRWEPYAAKIANSPGEVFVEREIALTRNLEETGWWDKDAWCRGKLDIGIVVGNVGGAFDWKTGKVKPDSDQLKLFAALMMQLRGGLELVRTGFVWLAHNRFTRQDYTRDDLLSIWADFIFRSRRLEDAYEKDKWQPIPSGLCRGWCPVGKDNCEFWSPKRK